MLMSRRCFLFIAAFLGASGGGCASPGGSVGAEPWSPPLGIPAPDFGITQQAPPVPSPWASPTPGFYYVDETAAGATDTSNPYGAPNRPRRTIPLSLPAGVVVELHGPYTKAHTSPNGITASGTATQPVYIRGSSPSTRPTITRSWQLKKCSYLVLENLKFAFVDAGRGLVVFGASTTHSVLRASEVSGNLDGGGAAVAASDNVVIYNNVIHDNGDVADMGDQDIHGIAVGGGTNTLWIVDNDISRSSGDGIQINGTLTNTHHIYVGRNVSHHNKQTGLWTKTASDVVFSENIVRGHRPSSSGDGAGMGAQYDPQRVWFLFNEAFDNSVGISTASGLKSGRSDFYFMGNVIHDNLKVGLQLNDWVNREYVIGNTFYNNPIGLGNGYYRVGVEISDNIFSNSATAHISFREYRSGAASKVRNNLFDAPVRIVWDDVTRDVSGMQSIAECQGCREGNPLFVNAAGARFDLLGGSPAIDAGVVEAAYDTYQALYGVDIRVDKAGRRRPQGPAWDLGAYELLAR
jgi:Right handed beta helix region